MRIIKFRAYGGRKMPWGIDSAQIFEPFGLKDFPEDLVETDWSAIMQFTGLKDKNGKEIYEGDIVSVYAKDFSEDKTNYEVKWYGEEGYPAFDLVGWSGDNNALSDIATTNEWSLRIIGNIYQNKNLIK